MFAAGGNVGCLCGVAVAEEGADSVYSTEVWVRYQGTEPAKTDDEQLRMRTVGSRSVADSQTVVGVALPATADATCAISPEGPMMLAALLIVPNACRRYRA